ncbi:MAG: DUF721 domain-containing protein [Nitrospirae bacterium]|nr:DUF721 domain-containing protein [Nitrospirota bacterium]
MHPLSPFWDSKKGITPNFFASGEPRYFGITLNFLKMQRAGNILYRFIKDCGLEDGLALRKIKDQWTTLAGETIAAHTSPQLLKGKILFITVDTPQWMHHLSFFKQEICEKLTSYKVEEIRFKLGKLDEDINNKLNTLRAPRLSDEDIQYIENTIRNIKDEELKKRFRVFLTHSLGHKRK